MSHNFDNALRQIKLILYKLKRLYGTQVIIKRLSNSSKNMETGVLTRTYTDYTIKRAIVLPAHKMRDFIYDLSFIAANKNFTYGGFFDINSRLIVIDSKDLSSIVPKVTDKCIFHSRRYEIDKVFNAEHNRGYLILCKEIANSPDEV